VDTGESEPAEDAWETTAAAMVDVFRVASDDSDEVRERRYKALLPKYRRLGKVAPEFRTIEELAVLEDQDLVNLFLEEEIAHSSSLIADSKSEHSERSGAVLSKRNMSDLEQAIALIQGVMERAKPVDEPEADADADPDPEKDQRNVVEKESENFKIDPVLLSTLEIQKILLFGGKNA